MYDDPGWKLSIGRLGLAIVWPPGVMRGARHGANPLAVLRTVYLALLGALFLFGVVLLFAPLETRSVGLFAYIVGGAGLISLGAVSYALSRPLTLTSASTLAGSYRGLFFIGVAFAESPATFGLVATLITGHRTMYLIGFAFALLGFGRVAPTRADIERRQLPITASGSTLSLGQALTTPSEPPSG